MFINEAETKLHNKNIHAAKVLVIFKVYIVQKLINDQNSIEWLADSTDYLIKPNW